MGGTPTSHTVNPWPPWLNPAMMSVTHRMWPVPAAWHGIVTLWHGIVTLQCGIMTVPWHHDPAAWHHDLVTWNHNSCQDSSRSSPCRTSDHQSPGFMMSVYRTCFSLSDPSLRIPWFLVFHPDHRGILPTAGPAHSLLAGLLCAQSRGSPSLPVSRHVPRISLRNSNILLNNGVVSKARSQRG